MFFNNNLVKRFGSHIFEHARNFSNNSCFFHSIYFKECWNQNLVRRQKVYSLILSRPMAGHAKWQNIQHVKAEKDRQKNLVSNKFAFLIRKAALEGGTDPKYNNKLASLIELAKKNKVSSSVIENNLKKQGKKSVVGSAEILGPGGCIVLIEYETDSVSILRHDVKVFCKKYGAHVLSGEGRWRAVFEQRGVVKAVARKDGDPLDPEKALDDAILAGAEEVVAKEEDSQPFLEFLCAPDDLNPVKKEIEKDYSVEEGYIMYNPIAHVELNPTDTVAFEGLLNDLESIPNIVRIFENVK